MKRLVRLRYGTAFLAACIVLTQNSPGQTAAPPAGLAAPGFRGDTAPQPGSPAQGGRPATPPTTADELKDALMSAKVIEEGDGNPREALDHYREIVRRFDEQRPLVAEALFRIAEITAKSGDKESAGKALARITTEFGDIESVASRAAQRLQSASSSPFQMSPELMRRYGLLPAGPSNVSSPSAPSAAPPMSSELMRRYALAPANPFVTPPSTVPRPDTQEADSPSSAVFSSAEPAQKQYPHPGAPLVATTPSRKALDSATELEIQLILQEIATSRAEATELSKRIRQIDRELRAAEGTISQIAVSLIQDVHVHRSLERLQTLQENLGRARSAEDQALSREAFEGAYAELSEYLQGPYRERLQRARAILEEERSELLALAEDGEARVRKLMSE